MHGLIREEGSFGANPGTKDLAKHLYTRMYYGKIVIVSDKPRSVISALRKQWLKLTRRVQKERASTLNAVRVAELSDIVSYMQKLDFTTHYPPDDYPGDVYIATVEEILRWPPVCRTMYVTCNIETEKLHMITAWMPRGGLVVIGPLASFRPP
ncbi:MAG TPA: hypothetical protein VFM05_12475 [Candidatus Saccharimonadales bacterium]|nr:hypothetical protein [Candidatus Saccharimonadales bacterium]